MGMLMRRHHNPVVEEPVPEVKVEEELPFTDPEEPVEPVKEPVKKPTARKTPVPAKSRRRTGK